MYVTNIHKLATNHDAITEHDVIFKLVKHNTCIAQIIMEVNFNMFSQSVITSYSKANQCLI